MEYLFLTVLLDVIELICRFPYASVVIYMNQFASIGNNNTLFLITTATTAEELIVDIDFCMPLWPLSVMNASAATLLDAHSLVDARSLVYAHSLVDVPSLVDACSLVDARSHGINVAILSSAKDGMMAVGRDW